MAGAQKDSETAGLSATERAALEDDADETGALDEIAGEGADDADDADDADAGDDAGEGADEGDEDEGKAKEPAKDPAKAGKPDAAADAAAAAAAAATAAAEADKPVDVIDDDDEDVATLPVLKVEVPKDAADQIKALKTEKRELFKQYNAGTITDEVYQEKLDEADGKLETLTEAVSAARLNAQIAEANQQQMATTWQRKVGSFMDEVKKTEGLDYRSNTALGAALDAVVKDLGNQKDKDGELVNGDKPMGWFLREAHRQVKASFGLVTVPKTAKPDDAGKPAAAGEQRKAKAPDLTKVPPNIRTAPSAAAAEDGGEFSHLATLSGMALEKAVARMTPEQQNRWAEET